MIDRHAFAALEALTGIAVAEHRVVLNSVMGALNLWDSTHGARGVDLLTAYLLGIVHGVTPGRAHLADHLQLCGRRLFRLARPSRRAHLFLRVYGTARFGERTLLSRPRALVHH